MEEENKQENVIEESLNYVFNETIVTLILWFLIVYFLISAFMGNFTLANPKFSILIRIFDFMILALLLLYILYSYFLDVSYQNESFLSISVPHQIFHQIILKNHEFVNDLNSHFHNY